jgi:hypothetical protein
MCIGMRATTLSTRWLEAIAASCMGKPKKHTLRHETNMASTMACISTPRGTGTLTDV